MRQVMYCRRTFIAVLSISCLTVLGLMNHLDVAMAITGVAAAIAGSNAYEARGKSAAANTYSEKG